MLARFANPNALQQYHQLLSMSGPAGYPNVSMYAPQQRPKFYGLATPFAGPQMGPTYPQLPIGGHRILSQRGPRQRTWSSFPQSIQRYRPPANQGGYGALVGQLPFRMPFVTR